MAGETLLSVDEKKFVCTLDRDSGEVSWLGVGLWGEEEERKACCWRI